MAEEAKAKPVEIKPKSSGKEYEFDRPMTSKEKEEYFREKAAQARRAAAAAAPVTTSFCCSKFSEAVILVALGFNVHFL